MAKRTRSTEKGTKKAAGEKTLVVDFSKDDGNSGGSRRFKEGDYKVKIKSVSLGHSKERETPFVQLALVFTEGKYKGTVWDGLRTRVYVTDGTVWRVRSLFEACGLPVPKKKSRVDFSKLEGQSLAVTIVDGDEYKGRISSEIADFVDPEALSDDEDDEDEDDDDDEDDDEDEDEDLEDMDVDDDL
jgi:ribosomal protein L12E/L44/L45/RPP1/RPP2